MISPKFCQVPGTSVGVRWSEMFLLMPPTRSLTPPLAGLFGNLLEVLDAR